MPTSGRLSDFGELLLPAEAAEPILGPATRAALMEWLTEIWACDALAEVGIAPRRRAMFDGPPGVGKTTLAHHLAARLGLPMLAVRPELIISKWVGETGERLGALFDLVARAEQPVLLFIDEFDALSRQRRRAQQSSDDSRNEEVDTLLQRLEQHDGIVIAATNFAAHIDQAIWRRFDMHVTLEMPGSRERALMLMRYLAPFGLPQGSLEALSDALASAAPALIRQFCEGLKRQIVMGPRLRQDMTRNAVVGRVLATVHPHPDLGKPRLWTLGAADHAVQTMPWPLPRADEIEAASYDDVVYSHKVVSIVPGAGRTS